MTEWQKARVLAFHQTTDYEHQKERAEMAKAMIGAR